MASTRLFVLYCFFFVFSIIFSVSESKALQPHAAESFNVSLIQKLRSSCSYTVIISTSCSSSRYTRDQISVAFGDAYGNQIYAPRLDDPSTKTFEQCSSDTFEINGPCTYQICYVYLYRSGPDGWIPESVKINAHGSKAVTFPYNTLVPESIWYGFNYCNSASDSSVLSIGLVLLGFVVAGSTLLL
ncbi:embryo-specific protein ATS3B isoform X2 [Brassica rapa]|uniref:embryo-specific protein ATS3B isoform X2 n=1 Tax=Brassica campestris TaxID=3711 RepID=UPI0004F16100|nr:embryo-specific protein ATS3B isoform X2 [Brassica rapa]